MSVGLDLKIPKLPADRLRAGDFVTWEALYDDGTLAREVEGVLYRSIDRPALRSFRLTAGGETLVEAFVPEGATGRNLLYRRRTGTGTHRTVRHLIAWVPMGPVLLLDAAAGTYRVEPYFTWAIEDFDPPTARANEGEHFTPDELAPRPA